MDYQTFADTYFGGNASAVAREFGLVPSTVANWKKTGRIPPLRAAAIELWIIKNKRRLARRAVSVDARKAAA